MSFIFFCNYFSALVITLLSKKSVAATWLRHSCLWAWNFFRKFFFLIKAYYWQSLVHKKFTKNNSICFYAFPLSFEMRIVWHLSRFNGEAPCFCIWLCSICPGEQDNNMLTGHQVFATRLTIAIICIYIYNSYNNVKDLVFFLLILCKGDIKASPS